MFPAEEPSDSPWRASAAVVVGKEDEEEEGRRKDRTLRLDFEEEEACGEEAWEEGC